MKHSEISDMPDFGGVNGDHDGRYHTKHKDLYIDLGTKIYFGDDNIIGSIRWVVVEGAFEIQVLTASGWVYRGRWSPPS